MPDVEEGTQKQPVCHQFLAGLTATDSKQLRATGKSLIVDQAKLLLTFDHEERTTTVGSPSPNSNEATSGVFSHATVHR